MLTLGQKLFGEAAPVKEAPKPMIYRHGQAPVWAQDNDGEIVFETFFPRHFDFISLSDVASLIQSRQAAVVYASFFVLYILIFCPHQGTP